VAFIRLLHDDGTPHLENIAEIERQLIAQHQGNIRVLQKREYWKSVLWNSQRVQYWIDALILEGVESLDFVTWLLIIKMMRNRAYKHLGKKGADQLAARAGIGERPQWVPGHWSISSDSPG